MKKIAYEAEFRTADIMLVASSEEFVRSTTFTVKRGNSNV